MLKIKKILVTSNCQTSGLVSSLKRLLINSDIQALPLPRIDNAEAIENLKSKVLLNDVWITSGFFDICDPANTRIIKIPKIVFPAFHPDLCYAYDRVNQSLTKYHYNSKIIIWCYNNKIDRSHVKKVFNPAVFAALGYFEYWNSSVELIKSEFLNLGYSLKNFNQFFNEVKRNGLFMHTTNHPHVSCLTALARLVCSQFDSRYFPENTDLIINDDLIDNIFPVYPAFAKFFSIQGSYNWLINGNVVRGLDSIVNYYYDSYITLGLKPGDVEMVDINTFYTNFDDNVISEIYKAIDYASV